MKIIRSLTLFAALLLPATAIGATQSASSGCCPSCPGCPCCE